MFTFLLRNVSQTQTVQCSLTYLSLYSLLHYIWLPFWTSQTSDRSLCWGVQLFRITPYWNGIALLWEYEFSMNGLFRKIFKWFINQFCLQLHFFRITIRGSHPEPFLVFLTTSAVMPSCKMDMASQSPYVAEPYFYILHSKHQIDIHFSITNPQYQQPITGNTYFDEHLNRLSCVKLKINLTYQAQPWWENHCNFLFTLTHTLLSLFPPWGR